MIDEATKQRILDAAKIEEVVGDFVTLRRRGVNLIGLCPFHNEKTPSFTVSPSKNICKCFGCGKGGTPVNFIMQHEHLSYPDALRYLAKKYNIEIVEKELTAEEMQARTKRESMMALNEFAGRYFVDQLWRTEEGQSVGLAYFRERGFSDAILQKFQLGYSQNQYHAFSDEAIKSGFSATVLNDVGLATRSDRGGMVDRFRGRVMFPVHSLSGRIVAFGGRVLVQTEKSAKYVNSPESEIYHKSNELYGIYFAKESMVQNDAVYLVEGYTDVLSMHEAGIQNVVASSGTSLTQGQIRMIHRFTSNITVLYDGDAAGIKASIRGIDLLLEEGMNVKVVLLPDGDDPDSFAKKHNANELIEYIKEHQVDFIQFKSGLLLEDAGNDPIKKSQLINDIVQSIAVIPDAITRSLYIQECAIRFSVRESLLGEAVQKLRQQKQVQKPVQEPAPIANATASVIVPIEPEIAQKAGAELPYTYNQEQVIMRYLVNYGKCNLSFYDAESNEHIQIPLATYVDLMLAEDEMPLQFPLHVQLLQEALQVEQTDLRTYFLNHTNLSIQNYVFSLVEDKYEHCRNSKDEDPNKLTSQLSQEMPQVILEFKLRTVKGRLKEVSEAIKQAQVQQDGAQLAQLIQQQVALVRTQQEIVDNLRESKIQRF
ncbi:MAG: DNA primase [Paludibacteraceae bacterium]|nr:DNA primase [Paludibacteraceae bacterium]